ncbi:Imm49 family immunity protein [Streptomyces sp. NPDC047525]|uniref:immunity 49 family protein n=1 Tax=Streptomyces sp. NPDC047525 TaxID=3155264 RepID=UPI0033C52051
MRIERHHIDEAAVLAAREDFTHQIGRRVRSMSKAGPITGYDWGLLAEEFVSYLGALSVETPDLHTPEAKAALRDASEAAAGKVAYAAYYPVASFHVSLDYVNFGMGYDAGSDGERETVSAYEWIDAFCLAVLAGRAEWHGEAFHFARETPQQDAAGRPAVELINGLMAYVMGDTGDDDASYPPSKEEKLAALDAALARIKDLDRELDAGLIDKPESTALRGLRALAAHAQEEFAAALTTLLTRHSSVSARSTQPDTLLPLLPLTLAALAYRREGWQVPVETDYLPHALVTGFETPGPRVGAFGRDRRPDAVAQLASGPVEFARPEHPRPLTDEIVALFQRDTDEVLAPDREEPVSAADWSDAMSDQESLFRFRSTLTSDVTDEQLANLALASRLGAEAFVAAQGEARRDPHYTGPWRWLTAVGFALITGAREHLAPLVLIDPALLADGSAYASYYQALHAYLRGTDPEEAAERAVADRENCVRWGFFPPPSVLLSQLVEGDEESFNLALIDALEAHRDHYRVADRAEDPNAAINLNILALTCHARRRGWNIHVSSPYLPARLLHAAQPL